MPASYQARQCIDCAPPRHGRPRFRVKLNQMASMANSAENVRLVRLPAQRFYACRALNAGRHANYQLRRYVSLDGGAEIGCNGEALASSLVVNMPCPHPLSPRGNTLFGGAKLETDHTGCNVQAGLHLDTEWLQRIGPVGSSNQKIGTGAYNDRCFGADAAVVTRPARRAHRRYRLAQGPAIAALPSASDRRPAPTS